MAARGFLRGHPMHYDEASECWRFDDTGEPTAETWFDRPCGHCGLYGNSNDGGVDPCLGELAGVTNACCGHGDPSQAYICFAGGLVIRGFEVDEFHHRVFSKAEKAMIRRHNEWRDRLRKSREEELA